MKKNMKTANFNDFFCFERKLLQDYLNDQSKKGYHLKINNYKHCFEYNPEKHVFYHIDAIKTKKRYMGQVKPDEVYLDMFESQGYRYLGSILYFNIFESELEESIFGDEREEDIVKNIFKHEFKSLMPNLILSIIFVCLAILVLFRGTVEPAYMFFSNDILILTIAFMFFHIGDFYCTYLPLIKYKMTKKVEYTYKDVLKRQFIHQTYTFVYLLYMLNIIITMNMRVVVAASLVFGVLAYVCIKNYDDAIADKVDNVGNIYICAIALIAMLFNTNNNEIILQHSQIRYKQYSQRSSLMEFSWYSLKETEDCLYFIDVYEPLLTDYIFNDFIGDNEYIKDGNTYFVNDYVVVRKENRILKMEKDFYENYLNTLDW